MAAMTNAREQDAVVRRLVDQLRLRDAAIECDLLNQQHPEYEAGWYTACRLAMAIEEPILAVRAIDRALQLSPGKPEWLFQRVEALVAAGDSAAAHDTALLLLNYEFNTAAAAARFADTLTALGNYEGGRRCYLRATELEPEQGQHWFNLAAAERLLHNVEAAEAAVNRCLELSPDDEEAHLLRAGLKTHSATDNNIDELEAALIRAEKHPRRRARICFALSKELEDTGAYDRAFELLSNACAYRRSGFDYTLQDDLHAMQKLQATFPLQMFDGRIEGHVNAEPIFIIGMPCTGSVFVESILALHSAVYSAGALQTFSTELLKHCRRLGNAPQGKLSDLIPLSPEASFESLGEDYIAGTRPGTNSAAHFVDRLPINFLYAGLIHLALPKAKIILLERDPMDACYAVYKTLFERLYPYSYDLNELAAYYVAYRQLIDHWQTVMPGVMQVVKYEELATRPEPVIESLLSYCGLSFEEACLRFHENVPESPTSSAVRVNTQALQSSIGKWRNYEKQLKPVSNILGEFL